MQQNIPAWKRIGLKLKYAKDPYDPPTQQYQVADSEIAGASNENHEVDETSNLDHARPLKKRKLSQDANAQLQPDFAKRSQGRSVRADPENTTVSTARSDTSSPEQSTQ